MAAPFVGEIPQEGKKQYRGLLQSGKKDETPHPIVVKEKHRDVINEAFRVVRTNLEFVAGSGSAENGKVMMVTSFNPGSGKTFIAANLATCFAIKGKKVVAVDLDLRKASLSRYVGHERTGVANYLVGQNVKLEDITFKEKDGESPLDIIPVGTIPPNPTELLTSPRLEQLLAELRKRYDCIFIDCPPSLNVFSVNALTAAENKLEEGEKLVQILSITVYVNAEEGFTSQSKVADMASEYFCEVLGEAGVGSRAAVGVASLPGSAPVEISITAAADRA